MIEAALRAHGFLNQPIGGNAIDLPIDVILPDALKLVEIAAAALEDGHVTLAEVFHLGRAVLETAARGRMEKHRRAHPPSMVDPPSDHELGDQDHATPVEVQSVVGPSGPWVGPLNPLNPLGG